MITLAIPAGLIVLALVLICVGPGRMLAVGSAIAARLERRRGHWLRRSDDPQRCSHRPR